MIGFLQSFVQYLIILIILAALAVAGVFTGKALRKKKDLKEIKENESQK